MLEGIWSNENTLAEEVAIGVVIRVLWCVCTVGGRRWAKWGPPRHCDKHRIVCLPGKVGDRPFSFFFLFLFFDLF